MNRGTIIVEGCDFSGKSTLIDRLSKELKAIVFKDNNIPPDEPAIHDWISRVNQLSKTRLVICDRSLLISDPIYGNIIRGGSPVGDNPTTDLMIVEDANILGPAYLSELTELRAVIWCDPGLEHVQQMNNQQMVGVKEHVDEIHEAYVKVREFYYYLDPIYWSNLTYNFKLHPIQGLINRLRVLVAGEDSEMEAVSRFHHKFAINQAPFPHPMEKEVSDFRLKFLREEIDELEQGINEGNLPKMFDALLDLVYVAKGTALILGISPKLWEYGFNRVQAANMTKIKAESAENSKRGYKFDVVKPPNFVPPEQDLILGIHIAIDQELKNES